MTAGFATRPLREVGRASRNRLLVDKMIVWRTILGLIMASKWPPPESQSACRFSMTDAKARDQRKQIPAMRAPTPRIPRLDFIKWAIGRLPPTIMRPIAKAFLGASSPSSIARIGRSGGVCQVPAASCENATHPLGLTSSRLRSGLIRRYTPHTYSVISNRKIRRSP
jgi:hypothetical protein